MNYLEITISTTPEKIDEIAARLTAAGFAELLLEDQQEFETFLEENRAYWDYIDEDLQQKLQGLSRIKLYLESTDTESLTRLRALTEELGLSMETTVLPETNWEESWKENYPAQPIGNKLIVIPYWMENPEPDRLPIIIDPGLTFGTGAHPTTQMVMEAMEDKIFPGCTCLDLGSGSGILSIAAIRLGSNSVNGVDIDPLAEEIAYNNGLYNHFEPPLYIMQSADLTTNKGLMRRLTEGHNDFVFVNIVADVICTLAPNLPKMMKEDGTLICSGILDVRLSDVISALENAGLTITEIREKEEWRCVCAKK